MNKLKPILKLNLQHFAEPAEPALTQEQAPQVAPQPVQAAPQLDINEIVSNLSNRINDTLNQRLSPIEQKLNAPVQPTKEQIEEQKEQIRQQMEDDPMQYQNNILELAEQRVMKRVEPELEKARQATNERMWERQVSQFKAQNPESNKYMPQIIQVLNENPELMGTKDPLGIAYKLAASNNLLGNGGNIVDNVLGNEEYMKQIMQNPTLKEQIIQEYQQGLNSGASQKLPPIMGNGQGGSIPVSGGETPKNLKEARMSALRRFQ